VSCCRIHVAASNCVCSKEGDPKFDKAEYEDGNPGELLLEDVQSG